MSVAASPESPLPDYQDWIGRTESAVEPVSEIAATRLAAVLDRKTSGEASPQETLFPVGHWLQFTPTASMSELGADGHAKLGGFMPPLELPRRMWAGSSITFHRAIGIGQTLSRTTTIESITPKEGSSGKLCFVVLRHDISADGVPALTEAQTIVYREALATDAARNSPQPPREDTPAPEGWDWAHARRSGAATLFRYSAITFNTHRIHYDLPYATGTEGYPGLVVHGPLSASYIVDDFLQQHPGAELSSFEFSARSPIFADEQVHVVGRQTAPGEEELAVIGPGGITAISARIRYTESAHNRV